ncbi:reverse transcriptase domain-containing protein [Tanacetum coccineum]
MDPFTSRIRNFKSSRKTRMPNTVKTYDGTGDPEDHLKIFQAAAQVERWAMPTWCHMFNSTLIGAARVWFDELPPESIDGYKGLKAAFLAYFMQQNKYVKDPVEIHNIKQRDGETIKDFIERFKVETGRMKGAPECMRISGFMHRVNNPELTKRLNEHVPKTMEEMMTVITAFIRGEAAAASKKKGHLTPKEILAAEAGKFKPPPPVVTPAEKRSSNKFCNFHNDKGHSTDECMQLKKQIEELRMTRQKLTQRFARGSEITFPPRANSDGTEGPLVIEAEIGGHMIHRMYIDGGSSMEILYEHCFNRLRPEIKNQIVLATTLLTGFSGETIWPLGQLRLLVTIGDAYHFTKEWMNFMIVRSLSPYNGIIGRLGIREIQAVPSTAHGMLKFPANGGIVTIRSTILIPAECTTVITSSKDRPQNVQRRSKRSPEGIKPCPEKTEAVLQLPSQRTIKEVQILNGKLASLNRFLSKSMEKSLPLFKTLKKCIKKSDFHWTPEVEQAFTQLKQHLSELPLLVAPKPKEELNVYLAASQGAISAILMTERDTVQTPVYFILADFLVEKPDENLLETPATDIPQEPWTLFTNGSSCIDGSGAGLILISPEGTEFTYELRFQFTASNNEAEYEALIAGLRIAAQMGVRNVRVSVDSKLVVNQVLGAYVPKEQNMIKYLEKVKSLVSSFASFSISQVPRSKNKKADALSKIASTSFAHLSKQVLVEILKEKSIHEEEVATVVEEEGTTWMTPIIEYLKDGTLPGDRKEASKLRIKARQYELLEGILYKRSFMKPWLRCVGPLQADYVIREIHEGSCSMHAGPRSVVAKAMRLGYYWPTMHRDAREMIRTCNDCQIHRPVPRNPQHPITSITAPWPFYKWGIDIAGPFPEGSGKVKFLIVAMDYFTKWIKAKAVATITGNQVKKIVWDNIVCRFGLPGEIISDNGKQFNDNPFKDWCDKLNITQRFASVKHPQSNGLVERANRSLGKGIKARLGEGNKNWVEKLPHVLWSHRMMIKSSHGDTPFSLTYGTEAVILAEIRMPTYRTSAVDTVHYDEELRLNLDLLEEKRERAAICEAKAKMKMTKYYNARVRSVAFKPEDFVYHSNDASRAAAEGKLGPKWEGPYEVTEALGDGAYKLRTMGGADLSRTWNVANLKKCYLSAAAHAWMNPHCR